MCINIYKYVYIYMYIYIYIHIVLHIEYTILSVLQTKWSFWKFQVSKFAKTVLVKQICFDLPATVWINPRRKALNCVQAWDQTENPPGVSAGSGGFMDLEKRASSANTCGSYLIIPTTMNGWMVRKLWKNIQTKISPFILDIAMASSGDWSSARRSWQFLLLGEKNT